MECITAGLIVSTGAKPMVCDTVMAQVMVVIHQLTHQPTPQHILRHILVRLTPIVRAVHVNVIMAMWSAEIVVSQETAFVMINLESCRVTILLVTLANVITDT
jgi:hypothetical protein